MQRSLLILALIALMVASVPASHAGMLGDRIQGELYFPELTGDRNLFDPANGLVPPTSNPDQPAATVIDPDDAFPEFHMYAPSSTNGLEIDVDDTTIQFRWYSQRDGVEWVGHRIVLSDLDLGEGVAIRNVVQHQNDVRGRVTWDAHSITVETDHYNVVTYSTLPSYLRLSIETAVGSQNTTFSRLKALYR